MFELTFEPLKQYQEYDYQILPLLPMSPMFPLLTQQWNIFLLPSLYQKSISTSLLLSFNS
ncbi:hypothetical protein [Nostoc sp. LPT]|uniref:hypothetical protein n=1 Tax=Nostoc sp. LPT TaxID=2815387 RepID=UPI001DC3A3F5|nr:hypothetical protein [Nostoc sp. LPT]MBN4002350.1 hypothetical protein [Nostoc sp. LPT]